MKNLYLGFEFAPLQNWQDILPAPKAPINYKDPVKIQAYIDARLVELEQGKAATELLSGRVSRAVVLGRTTESGDLTKLLDIMDMHAGHRTLQFITEFDGCTGSEQLGLFGYRIHRATRLMALDAMFDAKDVSLAYCWAAYRWALDLDYDFRYGQMPGYIDPVSVLFGSSDADLPAVCRRTGLPLVTEQSDAEEMATFAFGLAHKMGF
jgi:hypothetical protein